MTLFICALLSKGLPLSGVQENRVPTLAEVK